MIKTYLKSYAYLFGILLILTILLSIINYFIPFNSNTIKLIIPVVSSLVSSIILGKNIKVKGYIEGIKYAGIYLIIISILKLILKTNFNYKTIIMYLAITLTCIIGSMIGINIKKE